MSYETTETVWFITLWLSSKGFFRVEMNQRNNKSITSVIQRSDYKYLHLNLAHKFPISQAVLHDNLTRKTMSHVCLSFECIDPNTDCRQIVSLNAEWLNA